MTPAEAAPHLDIAVKAAALAAAALAEGAEGLRAAVTSLGKDIKIKADSAAEAAVLAYLARASAFPVLSEEAGEVPGRGDSEYRWILDPVDGSLNYNRGLPLCCVSVALWRGDRPVLGVIHDFNRGEVFTGVVGGGAFLNGTPLRVSAVAETSGAVLCTGFPVYTDFSPEPLRLFLERVRGFKKVRLLGSAALSLAYVAAGRADAYMEDNIMLWDVAAGLALVEAAGGRCLAEPMAKGLRVKADNGLI